MSLVFADAFYFVARLNRRDQHHERVVAFSREFRSQILTTDWVLMEVADALAKSECRSRIRDFTLHLRQASGCEVVPTSRDWLDRALELYQQHKDKEWTLTDCVSFVIMRERGITEA
jgi:predicted nucleic acid-binding protein